MRFSNQSKISLETGTWFHEIGLFGFFGFYFSGLFLHSEDKLGIYNATSSLWIDVIVSIDRYFNALSFSDIFSHNIGQRLFHVSS
jgi:hypothetical protein